MGSIPHIPSLTNLRILFALRGPSISLSLSNCSRTSSSDYAWCRCSLRVSMVTLVLWPSSGIVKVHVKGNSTRYLLYGFSGFSMSRRTSSSMVSGVVFITVLNSKKWLRLKSGRIVSTKRTSVFHVSVNQGEILKWTSIVKLFSELKIEVSDGNPWTINLRNG